MTLSNVQTVSIYLLLFKFVMNDITPTFPLVIAHRGASCEAPENTLAAIRQAIALKANWVEIDVHLSKDKIPVVIHDGAIPPAITGSHKLPVDTLTLAELQNLDAGSWFNTQFSNEKIPALSEVLKEPFQGSSLMIEIKEGSSSPLQLVTEIVKVINHQQVLPPLKIGSFSLEILQEIKKQAPSLPLIGITESHSMIKTFLNHKITHLAVWHQLLSKEMIQRLLQQNVHIWTFTVDSIERAEQLTSQGVHGIITNRPRELCEILLNPSRHR